MGLSILIHTQLGLDMVGMLEYEPASAGEVPIELDKIRSKCQTVVQTKIRSRCPKRIILVQDCNI